MQISLAMAQGGKAHSSVEVADACFGAAYNEGLVHQVVTAYFAGGRFGTKAQKSRAQARGGGAKPFRQKGMGRARAGSIRSPIWRSGGVTFAAQPRNYTQKVNRKMYRAAMRSIVSELLRSERLLVVESFSLDAPKTREAKAKLTELGLSDVLIITDEVDENLELAVRNLHYVAVATSREVNPAVLLAFRSVLVTVPALKQLEERLA